MNICVTNENFVDSITSIQSKSFFDADSIYRFLYDGLEPKYKKYLIENNLDKTKIFIYVTDPKKNKEIIKKYKHQIKFLKYEKHEIHVALDNIFKGKLDHKQCLIELNHFENRHILKWLESIAIASHVVARTTSEIDKYVDSPYFRHLVVYNLYGIGITARWVKK
jgi:hypothetical protein